MVPPVRAPDVAVSPAPSADAGAAPAEVGPAPQPPLPSFAPLFRRLSPSGVNIYTQEIVRQRLADRLRPGDLVGTSLGSGMVLDRSGHIITNAAYLPSRRGGKKDFLIHVESEDARELVAYMRSKGLDAEVRER